MEFGPTQANYAIRLVQDLPTTWDLQANYIDWCRLAHYMEFGVTQANYTQSDWWETCPLHGIWCHTS